MSSYDYRLKLLLAGNSSVGKSSLLNRYVEKCFHESMSATIGVDFRIKNLEVQGQDGEMKKVKLTIWDTAGQERFRTLSSSYWRGAQGVILVYDVTSRKSFEDITSWINEVDEYASYSNVVRLLVGNKTDLHSDRQVEKSEGEQFAKEKGMMFIEASALTSEGVDQAFEEVVYKILETESLAKTGTTIKTGVTEKLIQGQTEPEPQEEGCCW